MLAVGFLIGFRYHTSFLRLVAALLVALAFAYALSWVMAAVGLLVKKPEAAQSAVFLPVFPLYPPPSWLQGFATTNP